MPSSNALPIVLQPSKVAVRRGGVGNFVVRHQEEETRERQERGQQQPPPTSSKQCSKQRASRTLTQLHTNSHLGSQRGQPGRSSKQQDETSP